MTRFLLGLILGFIAGVVGTIFYELVQEMRYEGLPYVDGDPMDAGW